MADITYSSVATERKAQAGIVAGKGNANALQVLGVATIELGPSASGTTVKICRIPSNARISNRSRIYWDDLSTTGSPTIDIGLGSVDSNVTSDPDAINNGLAVSSADAEGVPLLADHANAGLPAWDLVSGVTSDPGGQLDVYLSVKDAATAGLTATVTVEVLGYFD